MSITYSKTLAPLGQPLELFRVSTPPRFLVHSGAVGWQGAFFTDCQPAATGTVDHVHQQVCLQHYATGFRVQDSQRGWRTIRPGVRLWLPGDEQRGQWQWKMGGSSQFLFIAPERIEQILGQRFRPEMLARWRVYSNTPAFVAHLIQAMCCDLVEDSPAGALAGDSLIAALVAYLASDVAPSAKGVARLAPHVRAAVFEYIETHLLEATSLADLADLVRMSQRHFCRTFRATTGLSPHQYLLQRRVERAKTLIVSGTRGLVEVALEAGFSDQSQLSRTFKRLTGLTPTRYLYTN